ncbi:hypothetical protein ABHN11_24480 [Brevibacillus centrosporus]|uniref:hypothetical protein n=1 Tax=Brevibacillus centrosporus TaxID=54910 RepID=UPI003D1FA5D3
MFWILIVIVATCLIGSYLFIRILQEKPSQQAVDEYLAVLRKKHQLTAPTETKKFRIPVEKIGFLKYLSSQYFNEEARRFGLFLPRFYFYRQVGTGLIIGILAYVVFKMWIIIIFTFIGSYLLPWRKILKAMKDTENQINQDIEIFIENISQHLSTFSSFPDALQLTLEQGIREPLRSDIEAALPKVRSGERAKEVFETLGRKYRVKEFFIFAKLLGPITEVGGDKYQDTLQNLARDILLNKMKKQKLKTETLQHVKTFQNQLKMIAGAFLVFRFVPFFEELYKSLTETTTGQLLMIGAVLFTIFASIRINKLANWKEEFVIED